MYKKLILIDLDGVLNEYTGDFDINYIPDIREGAKEFLINLAVDYRIKIYTTRNKVLAVKWLVRNELDEVIEDITNIKEVCWLFIDDRCIKFNGDYKELESQITDFKAWYKRG